jgi:hypothetical protein
MVSVSGSSGSPYTIRTGHDENGDSLYNDRPAGVARNTARGAAQWTSYGSLAYVIGFGSRRVPLPPGVMIMPSGGGLNVGTMSGQVIMQGFLERHIPVWLRRLVTILPSLVVIFLGFDPTRTLVISQVVLSFGLPFAVIPLVKFSRHRDLMKEMVNHRLTTAASYVVTALIVALNVYLLYQTLLGGD